MVVAVEEGGAARMGSGGGIFEAAAVVDFVGCFLRGVGSMEDTTFGFWFP